MTSSSPSPSQALRVLLAGLCSSEDISCGNEEFKTSFKIKKNQTEITDVEIGNISRDIFFSPKVIANYISSALLDIKWDEEKDLEGVDWEEYFDFENAQVVFDTSTPEESGVSHEFWIANIDKNWLITCSGYMGEYYDDDYDIDAVFTVHTNINKLDFEEKLEKAVDQFVSYRVSSFCSELQSAKSSLPLEKQHLIDEMTVKHLKNQDVTKMYVSSVEKDIIQSHLDGYQQDDSTVISTPPKKSRLI